MTDASPRHAVIDALMSLAEHQDWHRIELTDIAREANVSLADLRDLFPSKGAILGGFDRMIDRKVLQQVQNDQPGETAHDRLFHVYMTRLDMLAPYKTALRRITRAVRRDPLTLAALNQVALNTQRFMLAAANIQTEGAGGALKLQGAAILFSRVMDVWFEDNDPDQSRTMARLDRELRKGAKIVHRTQNVAREAWRLSAPIRSICKSLREGKERRSRREGSSSMDNGDLRPLGSGSDL